MRIARYSFMAPEKLIGLRDRFLAALRDYASHVTFLSIPTLHPARRVNPRMPNRFVVLLAVATCAAVGFAGSPGVGARPFAAIPTATAETEVDVELVFAVDVSYSMDPDEQALQREGYVTALRSREFLDALQHLTLGRIALTYIEWAGVSDQKILMPWRLIDGPESAAAVANEIARAPYRRAYRTSISGGLAFAAAQLESSPYRGRRVIDVSGDGANNQGPPVVGVRDEVVAKGTTINGLPIMLKPPTPGSVDIDNLDVYYEDCVMGGPSAFVVPIKDRDQFIAATRTKLVLEIADRPLPPLVRPTSAEAPRISCTIGERLWQQRWGSGTDFN
jgi:Protein of unknown function (DUF1194)